MAACTDGHSFGFAIVVIWLSLHWFSKLLLLLCEWLTLDAKFPVLFHIIHILPLYTLLIICIGVGAPVQV